MFSIFSDRNDFQVGQWQSWTEKYHLGECAHFAVDAINPPNQILATIVGIGQIYPIDDEIQVHFNKVFFHLHDDSKELSK
jgi:hypothetical protein